MTSQPQPPGETTPVGQFIRPLRDLAVWALVGVPAVLLFVAIIRLIPVGDGEVFVSRTQDSFYAFVNLTTIFFPLTALLLALAVQPRHPKAKLITMIVLGEYAAAAFFGVVFGFLVGVVQIAGSSVRTAFEELLVRAAWLALFALAAFAAYKIWRGLFYVPKPVAPPGVYGQPQYGVPGTYPGQPGYGAGPQQPGFGPPAPGQPGFGQAGFGQPGFGQPQPGQAQPQQPGQPAQSSAGEQPAWAQQPASGGQPAYGQPGPGQPAYGQPAYGQPVYGGQGASQPPAWGQPPVSAQPSSAAPAPFGQPAAPGHPDPGTPSYQPPSGQSTWATPDPVSSAPGSPATPPGPYPPGQAPATPGTYGTPAASAPAGPGHDHTMIDRGDDRTEVVGDERPGFGPADQDPPRR